MRTQPVDAERVSSLPPQAWLLRVTDRAQLWHGANVDISGLAFFEGAWADIFASFDFANCENVFGSGAFHTSEGWILVPPSHTLEAIYAVRLRDGQWFASNSLAFIKSRTPLDFRVSASELQRAFIGIVHGISHSPHRVPITGGSLYIIHHHNALLMPDGLQVLPKPMSRAFDNFASYRNYLIQTVGAVARNAADRDRRKTYRLLSTVSSGYDSPACASIARANGCTEAVTFVNARGGATDDGSLIAQQLELNCEPVTRPDDAPDREDRAAEFLATGMHGEDIIYDALRGKLDGRLFVTGFHGDKIWDVHSDANSVLNRGDISGSSLGEFRISQGFIHLPLPFIGAQRHADILRMSRSAEMKSFRIGGSYDRPIPRRIAEEAGVARNAFGQSKKAISLLIFSDQQLIGHRLRSQIERKSLMYRAKALLFNVRMRAYTLRYSRRLALLPQPFGHLAKKFIGIIANAVMLGQDWAFFEHTHPFNTLAFYWALDTMQERYSRTQGD
jgi:hypothetical protein